MKLEDWYKKTERPEERELRRKLRRAAIAEAAGGAVVAGMGGLLCWLYLAATPPQSSAINELEREGATERALHNREAGEQQADDSKERAGEEGATERALQNREAGEQQADNSKGRAGEEGATERALQNQEARP